MARLDLKLLGGFQARLVPGGPLNIPTRKARALLAYLALPAGKPHARDTLAALLWGDVPEAQSRGSLRKALFWLRQALGDTVTADAETVELKASAVSIDVGQFERRVADGSATALAEAADLYQGDLLAGLTLHEAPFEEWLGGQRERLSELWIKALVRLLAHQRGAGQMDSAILTAVKLIAADPLQEPVHRTLMQLYMHAGRRGAALRQYQSCVTFLERELRTQPEEATKALYREILRSPGRAVSTPEEPAPAPKGTTTVAGVAVSSGIAPPLSSAEAPLIGRQREMSQLTGLLNDAWTGGRRLVVIVGEAGVGKSRLAAGVAARALQQGGQVLLGRSYESEQSLPFSPWIDAFRSARLAANSEVIGKLSPVWRSELARLLPELADDALPPTNPADAQRLFEAVAQCLDAVAGFAPLLIMVEDLQWADELSVRLAAFLARRSHTGPMLVLGTRRAGDVEAGGPRRALAAALTREGVLVRLYLSRLTRDETVALTRELAGASPTPVLAAMEDEIWRISEGNPFMVVETVRAVRERGHAPGAWEGLVPARVRDLIAGRLRTLTDRGRRLLDVAAVIGRRFEFALLQRASGLDEDEAADGVEELVRRRILEQTEGDFEFTHDQIREVHHADLMAPRRALLHRRVAAALELLHPGEVGLALALGTHYREAGDWEKAVVHLRQAGLIAASRDAGREAAACFEEALRALDHLPASRQSLEQRFDLSLGLNRIQYGFGQFDRAMTSYRDAERVAHTLGDNRRLGRVLGVLGYLLTSAGRYVEAIDSGQRALAIAEATADRSLGVRMTIALGRSYFAIGDYRRGVELTLGLAESMDEAQLDEDLRPADLLPSVGCRTWLALCAERLGSFDEALRWAEDAMRIANGTDNLQAQVWACYTLGHVSLARGDADVSLPFLERAQTLCEKGEFPVYRPRVLGALGQARAFTGKLDDGLGLLEQALKEARTTRVAYGYTALLIAQAETYLEAARLDDAARVAVEALPVARERGERGDEGWLCGVLGAVALRRGRSAVDEATARFEEANAVARELAMRPLEARCLAGLGEADLLAGRRQDARAHLAEAVSLLRAVAMHRWLVPAAALLAITV
jgi:DNA-binding SARP family transcriptional activator